jgi:polyisoprenoid-binding protein YceI
MLVVLASGRTAQAEVSTWRIDTENSQLLAHVYRKGALSRFAHDHHFAPEKWSGRIILDPERPGQARVQIDIAASSLQDRQPKLSEKDVQKVDAMATGPHGVDAGRFPEIRLEADRLKVEEETETELAGTLVGRLYLHGRNRPIEIPVRARVSSSSIRAEGSVSFKQSEFGIEPYRSLLGTVAVQDQVVVEFRVVALPGA